MSTKSNSVLLLKVQKDNDGVDKYADILERNNFEVICIKSLVFRFKNLESLAEKLSRPDDYIGVLFSSPRCVEAAKLATKTKLHNWKHKSNWVVGEATFEDCLEKLGLDCKGKEAGNSENLSKLIIAGLDHLDTEKAFLFPHGNLATKTLETELGKHGLRVDGVLVYDTMPNPDIELELTKYTQDFKRITDFVVFFSPSGVTAFVDYFRRFPNLDLIKFIAIGPVTEKALIKEGLPVFAVAKSPSPEELLNVLKCDRI